MQKSKHQKTNGFIMLGTGLAASLGGIIMVNDATKGSITPNTIMIPDEGVAGAVLLAGGIVCLAASVPFFISSGKNKRKAAESNAGLINQPLLMREMPLAYARNFPAFSLRLHLQKGTK